MKFLKTLFDTSPVPRAAAAPEMAVAQLLLEIARADLGTQPAELEVIRQHLAQAYGLDSARLDAFIADARTRTEAAVSLHDSVETLNRSLDPTQKSALVGQLWRVAFADQRLDPHEEALLRRLADLLHVPHSDFIREKLAVRGP